MRRKLISTILIIVVSVALIMIFIYIRGTNDKVVPLYTGVIFAIIPALLLNYIWNEKFFKKGNKPNGDE